MSEAVTAEGSQGQAIQPRERRLAGFWHRFKRNRLAVFGLVIVALMLLTAILAPLIAPKDPQAQNYALTLQPPWVGGLMGTDSLGSDVFSRVVFGARISLYSSLISVGIALLVGGLGFAMIAIGIGFVPAFVRITRAQVLTVRSLDYVDAARAIGTGHVGIMLRHVLPNSLPPLLVQTTLAVGYAIIAEATLSIMGRGAEPGQPSWGSMLFQAQSYLTTAWWMAFFPGMAIFFAVLGFNLLGDGVREALDPRTYD